MLLEKGIEYHCRRGLRKDCSCDYCNAKRLATRRMSLLFYYKPPSDWARERQRYMSLPWDTIEDFIYAEKATKRAKERQKIRAELKALREE